jgi:hypothetical protein
MKEFWRKRATLEEYYFYPKIWYCGCVDFIDGKWLCYPHFGKYNSSFEVASLEEGQSKMWELWNNYLSE